MRRKGKANSLADYLRRYMAGMGIYHDWSPLRLPRKPTDTKPGTQARLDVYRKRLERGEALFHPNDSRDPAPRGIGRGAYTRLGSLQEDRDARDCRKPMITDDLEGF